MTNHSLQKMGRLIHSVYVDPDDSRGAGLYTHETEKCHHVCAALENGQNIELVLVIGQKQQHQPRA